MTMESRARARRERVAIVMRDVASWIAAILMFLAPLVVVAALASCGPADKRRPLLQIEVQNRTVYMLKVTPVVAGRTVGNPTDVDPNRAVTFSADLGAIPLSVTLWVEEQFTMARWWPDPVFLAGRDYPPAGPIVLELR